jgi:hypothetical protein
LLAVNEMRIAFGDLRTRQKIVSEALGMGISLEELETTQDELDGFPSVYAKARER